jgi:glucosylceramidase
MGLSSPQTVLDDNSKLYAVFRFLDEYRKQNLTFWALTTGNEPLNGIVPVNRFNSMGWTPVSHREWIGRYMGPRLKGSEHKDTLLFAIDDQRIVLPWWIKMVRPYIYITNMY